MPTKAHSNRHGRHLLHGRHAYLGGDPDYCLRSLEASYYHFHISPRIMLFLLTFKRYIRVFKILATYTGASLILFSILQPILLSNATVPTALIWWRHTSAGNSRDMPLSSYSPHGIPIYADHNLPSPTVRTIDSLSWGRDHEDPTDGSLNSTRLHHPRLFAPKYMWNRLATLAAVDPFLMRWNKTIFDKAMAFYNMTPTNYAIDGSLEAGGVLDVAREVQLRVKHWAYAYHLSNDTKWLDRTWKEIVLASGNSSQYFGRNGDNWNSRWKSPN